MDRLQAPLTKHELTLRARVRMHREREQVVPGGLGCLKLSGRRKQRSRDGRLGFRCREVRPSEWTAIKSVLWKEARPRRDEVAVTWMAFREGIPPFPLLKDKVPSRIFGVEESTFHHNRPLGEEIPFGSLKDAPSSRPKRIFHCLPGNLKMLSLASPSKAPR